MHFEQFLILAIAHIHHAGFLLQSHDALVVQLIHLAEFEVIVEGLLFDAVLALGAIFAELLLRVNESPLLVDFLPLEIADGMRQSDVFLLEDANLIC